MDRFLLIEKVSETRCLDPHSPEGRTRWMRAGRGRLTYQKMSHSCPRVSTTWEDGANESRRDLLSSSALVSLMGVNSAAVTP